MKDGPYKVSGECRLVKESGDNLETVTFLLSAAVAHPGKCLPAIEVTASSVSEIVTRPLGRELLLRLLY